MKTNYEQQAIDFLKKTNVLMEIKFLKNDFHFVGDKEKRDIYQITLIRGARAYTFTFGQSIDKSLRFQDKLNKRVYSANGKGICNNYKYLKPEEFPKNKHEEIRSDFKIINGEKPTEYDILACLEKYDVGSFDDFCSEFGYDDLPMKEYENVKKVYLGCKEEYNKLCAIFNEDEMEELRDIN